MEMNLREQLNGVQHIGIPTNDIENTIEFYQKLGFEIAFRTVNEEANEKVVLFEKNGAEISLDHLSTGENKLFLEVHTSLRIFLFLIILQ